jgi:hypothetical protein
MMTAITGANFRDGAYISFLSPYEDTRNIWIKTREASFEEAIPVTAVTERPIMGYFWSRDGKYLLYVMDKGGDENFNIYAVDPKEASAGVIPEARNITNMEGVRAAIYHISRIDPDLMFVGLNSRDKAWHDLYSLKISTGELTLMRENTNRYTDGCSTMRTSFAWPCAHCRWQGRTVRIDQEGETLALLMERA